MSSLEPQKTEIEITLTSGYKKKRQFHRNFEGHVIFYGNCGGVGSSRKADELEKATEIRIYGIPLQNSQDPYNWSLSRYW